MTNQPIHAIYQMHKQPILDKELEDNIKIQFCLLCRTRSGIRNQDIPRLNSVIRWLIAVLVDSVRSGRARPIVLPLGHSHYENRPFGYRMVKSVLEAFLAEKCIHIRKAKPSVFGGNASEIRASQWFVNTYKHHLIPWVQNPSNSSVLELRLTDYDDFLDARTALPIQAGLETRGWSLNLRLINDWNQSVPIFLLENDQTIRQILRERHITFHETRYVRSFCRGRLDRGGRFYNTWWQLIPSEYRSTISIDGEPVVELDYSAMAIRLLYAQLGLQTPIDPYDLGLSSENIELKRKILKRFILAITNDKGARFRLKRNEYQVLGVDHHSLVQLLRVRHLAINHFFFTDKGVELQYLDSQIAEQVMLEGVASGILILSVHDSFIVQEKHEGLLEQIMYDVYTKLVGWPPVIRKEQRKRSPQLNLPRCETRYASHFHLTHLASEIASGRHQLSPGGLADLPLHWSMEAV
jgi:hypothetical protein